MYCLQLTLAENTFLCRINQVTLLSTASHADAYLNSMKEKPCAYCGKSFAKLDHEHVFSRCLYPASKNDSRVQRLTIPACNECNKGWSDDEAHFRNMLNLSGEPNPTRQELWPTILRSFYEIDGHRRVNDIFAQMRMVNTAEGERYMIFPGKDERVLRVMRKIIRGLSYYHGFSSPISDKRIWVDVMQFIVPQEFLDQMKYHHREPDIAEYRFQILNEEGINSAWLISFFQRVSFIGFVSMSETGLSA